MTFRRALAASMVAGAWVLFAPPPVLAQQLPDAGGTLRQIEQPQLQLPAEPPPGIEIEQPGDGTSAAGPTVRFTLNALRITGSTAYTEAALLPLVADLIGRDVGFADLEEAAGRITRFYREHGYPVARAYLPAQQIREGAVEIAVLEGRFGVLQLRNESRISDARVRSYLDDVESGALVQGARLERNLLLLSDLDGAASPSAVLRPGSEVGETDLGLTLAAEPMLRGSLGYDNAGNSFTGRDRATASVDVVSPFGWSDVLSFSGIKEFPGTDFASVNYELPIFSDGIRFHAGYSRLEYDLGKEFAPLDASGTADTWRAGLSYPMVRSRVFNVDTNADFEYGDLEDRIDAADTVTERYYFWVAWGLSGNFHDGLFGGGVNAFSFNWTAGELDIGTPAAAAIDDVTLHTDEVFQRWNLQFLRLQRLTDDLSLYLSVTTQKADGNLDSSQKLVVGGPYGVRAFAPGEASGDSGLMFTGELRYDFDLPSVPGALQAAAFFDRAHVTFYEDPFPAGSENHRNLNAAGLTLNWQRAGDFFVRAVYAHRVGGSKARSDSGDDAKLWLEATKYF